MRTMKLLITGGIATTALLASTAVTASAQSTTIKDKRADVLHYKTLDSKPTFLSKAKSTASGIDITKAKIDYSKKKLAITYTFAKLSKKKVNVLGLVKTNAGMFYFANDGSKKVTVYDMEDFSKTCSASKVAKKSGKKGTIKVTLKRSCFDNAKKVRVMTSIMTPGGEYASSGISAKEDIVSPKKTKLPSYTKWLKAS